MVGSELIEKLAEFASQGRLALFLGTGFSKAVLGYLPLVPEHYLADLAARVLSWIELLSRCREELKLPSKEYHKGLAIDCPAEASEIVAELAKTIGRVNAKRVFKATIAKIVDFYPNPKQACAYQGLLKVYDTLYRMTVRRTSLNQVAIRLHTRCGESSLFEH